MADSGVAMTGLECAHELEGTPLASKTVRVLDGNGVLDCFADHGSDGRTALASCAPEPPHLVLGERDLCPDHGWDDISATAG